MSDLPSYRNIDIFQFADDTAIGRSISKTENDNDKKEFQRALNRVHQWFTIWKLDLAETKTSLKIFRRSKKKINDITFTLGPATIIPEENGMCKAPYLGLRLDNQLDWNEHVAYLGKKIDQRLRALRRIAGWLWGPKKPGEKNL